MSKTDGFGGRGNAVREVLQRVSAPALEEAYDGVANLICPGCGDSADTWLHQKSVRLIWRREDGVGEVVTSSLDEPAPKQARWGSGCPGRRQSMDIVFWCELCDKTYTLRIMQHKGQTQLQWVDGALEGGSTEDWL